MHSHKIKVYLRFLWSMDRENKQSNKEGLYRSHESTRELIYNTAAGFIFINPSIHN